jgi:hypothetical protein
LIIPSHALRGSRSLSNFTCHVVRDEDARNQRRTLGSRVGSRVDAPQKPNCRSPEQGLNRQGLRRHLPSRLSVRAELVCQVSEVLLYLTSRRGKLKEKGRQGIDRRTRVLHAADEETDN